jgi:hypothetical protein
MVATEIEELEAKAAKERQVAAGIHGKEGGRGNKKDENPSAKNGGGVSGDARDKAAKLLNVSHTKVSEAKKVKAASPELAAKVRSGEMKLRQAKEQIAKDTRETKRREAAKGVAIHLRRQACSG